MNKLRTCVHHGTTYKAHPCKKTPRLPGLIFFLDCFDCGTKPPHWVQGPQQPRGGGGGTTTLGLKSSHLGDVSLLLSLKRDRKNKHVAVLCECPAIGYPLFLIFSWGRVWRGGTVVSRYFVLARNPSSPSSPPTVCIRGQPSFGKATERGLGVWFRCRCSIPTPNPTSPPLQPTVPASCPFWHQLWHHNIMAATRETR